MKHPSDYHTVYSYLSEILVKTGGKVSAGSLIGKSGRHVPFKKNVLYFEIRYQTEANDPLLYLEYKIQTDRTYPDKWETKLILAKDIVDLNIAVNIIPEETYKKGSKEKEWKTEYAFGMSYPVVVDLFRIGIDSKGDLTNNKHMLGPVISFEGKRIWTAISPIFGLNKKSDDLRVQMIAGIVF